MPQPTVTISSPSGNTAIPTDATGQAQPSSGATLVGMAYQIDNGPVNSLPNTAYHAAGGSWTFRLTIADCPQLTSYLLTVYAGDSTSHFGTDAVNLTRTS